MPAPSLPIRPHHMVPVALVIALAMLTYFAHVVQAAVERGHAPQRAASTTPAVLDETDTIAFAVHAVHTMHSAQVVPTSAPAAR